MKRILSILSVFAMIITMLAAITLPTVAEEETVLDSSAADTRLVNLFDKSTAVPGILNKDGTIKSNSNFHTSDYIAVQPGDIVTLGPCYFGKTSNYSFVTFDQDKASPTLITNGTLTQDYSFNVDGYSTTFFLTSYTVPEGVYYIRVCAANGVLD